MSKRRRCCISFCDSRSGINERILFKVPEDSKVQWMNAISPHLYKGAHNRKHVYVCDLHFKDGDVQYYYDVQCKDGSVFKLKRGIPTLNSGCIPCINHDTLQLIECLTEEKKCECCNISLPCDCHSTLIESTKCEKCFLTEKDITHPFTLDIFHDSSTVSKFDAVAEKDDHKPIGQNEIAENERLDSLIDAVAEKDDHKPVGQNEIAVNERLDSLIDAVADKDDHKPVGQNEIADNERLDSLNFQTVKFHDRIISLVHTEDEILLQFKENNIDIRRYDKGMNAKRILLIGNVMIQCPECKVTFNNDRLKHHFVMEHGDIDLSILERACKCTRKFCDFIYSTNRRRPHVCPVCEIHTYTMKLLLKHITDFHKDYRPYKCEKCGKCFRRKHELTAHFKKFQNLPTCDYRKCNVCSEMIRKENYLNHCKSHKKFVCEECGLSFLKLSHLNMHRVKHRNKKKRRQQLCTVCGILTTYLQTHMKAQHTVRTKKYMCHKCSKLFFSQLYLRKHFESVHLRLKTVKCLDCNKKFSTSGCYKSHYRLKHAKNYKYSCKICEQQFTRGDYFRRHMNNHCYREENNKYGGGNSCNGGDCRRRYNPDTQFDTMKCKFCQKTFKSVHNLRLHVLTHVQGIRYKCKFCNISFSNAANRHRHQLKHKDPAFELSCKICWHRSKTKEDLEKHLEKHRNKEKYKCQHCEELFSRKYLLNHHIFEKHTSKENVMEMRQTILDEALEDFIL